MGARVRTGWIGAISLLATATILGVAWASVPNLIALRTKNSELTMVGGLLMTLPILFLTPAFFPSRSCRRDPPRRGGESSGLRDRDRSATHEPRQRLGSGPSDSNRSRGRKRRSHPVGGVGLPAAHGMTAVGQLSPP